MRKIEEDACRAFWGGRVFCRDNTQVTVDGDEVTMFLHGSKIARRYGIRVEIQDGGYQSRTTKSRLNAVLSELGMMIQQKQYEWRLYRVVQDSISPPRTFPSDEWVVVVEGTPTEQLAATARKVL